MHITFYGAVREVTGSMHLVSTQHDRILLDCGMFQGRRKEAAEKNRVMPIDPRILTNVILSHAHIDHSGRLPLLAKQNFTGRIICTRATAAASEYLLKDAAHIQESDADYLNYKTVRSSLSQMESSLQTKKRARKDAAADLKKILKKDGHGLNVDLINELIASYRLERVDALYTVDDAQQALASFDGFPYRNPITVGRQMTCTLYDAARR